MWLVSLGLEDARVRGVWRLEAFHQVKHGWMQAREVALHGCLSVNGDCRAQPAFDVLPPGPVKPPTFVKIGTAKDPVKCFS